MSDKKESKPPSVDTTTSHNEKFKTHCPGPAIPSRIHPPGGYRPTGWEVVRWPEFIAFAKRLGINLELPFTDVVIIIPLETTVRIEQTYLADGIDQKKATTSFDQDVKELIEATAERP